MAEKLADALHQKYSPEHPKQPLVEIRENTCPVCGAELVHEKCKVVCRSGKCVYRIVLNCSEF